MSTVSVCLLPAHKLIDVLKVPNLCKVTHLLIASANNIGQQDSLQAFSSSIAGLLSSRAVLQGKQGWHSKIFIIVVCFGIVNRNESAGVGVGDADASPTAALLLSIVQESMGRIATILFAHKFGTSLEPECKMYRLAADVFNDTAMILDCLSPALPKLARVILLSFSSILKALCGVTAGSSKASLSAHFAKWGNLGELNAVGNLPFHACLGQSSCVHCLSISTT